MKTTILIFFLGITLSYGQGVSEEAKQHFDRGMAALELARETLDYKPAIKELEQAASLSPYSEVIFFNLGMVQEKAQKYSDAVKSFKQYLILAPNASDAETVKSLITKMEYKIENVLSVNDIIDVLVSFSNSDLWDNVRGNCIAQPFAYISRKNYNSIEFPFLYGLEWGPDMRSLDSVEITGSIVNIKINTMCGPGSQAAECHFICENEIQILSKTQVIIKQKISQTELSIIKTPVRNGIYTCEYIKK